MSEFSNKALGLLSIDIPIPEFLIISISAFPLPKVITSENLIFNFFSKKSKAKNLVPLRLDISQNEVMILLLIKSSPLTHEV